MKRYIRIAFLSVCLAVGQANAQSDFKGVVAHRAGIYDDKALPENSYAALHKSAEMGVNAIEIDVHLSKDGVVVVNHDHDFQGMDIATNTYADLKSVGKLSNGETLSTLHDYIREIKKHRGLALWVDIKRSNVDMAWDVKAGEAVAKTITAARAEDVAAVIAPMFPAVVKIKLVNPKIKIYYIGVEYPPAVVKLLGFEGINLQHKRYAKEYDMPALQQAGLAVGAYVVDDPAIMDSLLDQNVDFITTNKPAVLTDLVKRRKAGK